MADSAALSELNGFLFPERSSLSPNERLSSASPLSLTNCGSSSPSRLSEGYNVSSSKPCSSSSTSLNYEEMTETGLWVYGYGSLCWHQGFDFTNSLTGCIRGYSRRFWQGNTTHRGTIEKPGRVATLVEDYGGLVWGQAFQVHGDAALPYLNKRECELGGYMTVLTTFYPKNCSTSPFPVLLYIATPSNQHWLGESPLSIIADQIIECKGNSGHNVEYLLRLAEYMRETFPEATDNHLYGLEELVREKVNKRKMCLQTLMGQAPRFDVPEGAEPTAAEIAPAPSSTQFSNRVPSKKLRCVNI